jgi:uncharacterized membrane protein YGL010W
MYAAYHRDRRNQATHHIGVPMIVFALLLASNQLVLAEIGAARITFGQLLLGGLMALYLGSVPLVGIFASVFYAVIYALVLRVPADWIWPVAGGAFVLGWIVQFVGHVFEGRRPAFLVNLAQVFMAPAFLIAEMLFGIGLAQPLAADLTRRAEKYAVS